MNPSERSGHFEMSHRCRLGGRWAGTGWAGYHPEAFPKTAPVCGGLVLRQHEGLQQHLPAHRGVLIHLLQLVHRPQRSPPSHTQHTSLKKVLTALQTALGSTGPKNREGGVTSSGRMGIGCEFPLFGPGGCSHRPPTHPKGFMGRLGGGWGVGPTTPDPLLEV